MTKKKVLIIDPPSGWLYGFPKPFPDDDITCDAEFEDWLLKQGYPVQLLDSALKHSRWWTTDVSSEES